jgi:hypothetical protein
MLKVVCFELEDEKVKLVEPLGFPEKNVSLQAKG